MQVCADFPSYSRQVVFLPLQTALHIHHNYSHSKLPIPFCLYILIGRTIGSLFNQLRKRLVPSKQVVRILCQQHCLPSPRHISLASFYSSSLSSFPFPAFSICVGCLIKVGNQLVNQKGVEHVYCDEMIACMHDSCYDIHGVGIPMTARVSEMVGAAPSFSNLFFSVLSCNHRCIFRYWGPFVCTNLPRGL